MGLACAAIVVREEEPMPDVLVRGVPQVTLDALKARAAEQQRSLQQELLRILEGAAQEAAGRDPAAVAAAVRARLARPGRRFSDSTPVIREDRER
jgi:plasmid stability protein